MSGSPLKKFVLTPVLISAGVFATLSLPLAILGKQQVRIQLQSEPVYQGQLRDVATPYLALASLISLGAGVASVALTGWRSSTQKSSEVEAQLSTLAQSLEEREAQLQSLKLSQERLEASGLSAFVDEEFPLEPILETPEPNLPEVPVVEEVKPLVITEQPFTVPSEIAVTNTPSVQAAAAKFASAQMFLGYAQRKDSVNTTPNIPEIAPAEVDKLYAQLEEIKAQMASMQQLISATKSTVTSTSSEVPIPIQPHLQVVKSWSVNDAVS